MGGQACVLYGAAEFSRDTDLTLLATTDNLRRFELAVAELRAELIAVPPLSLDYLARGHAVHFRCHHPDAEGIRVDVMSVLRGVAPFDELWARRTTIELPGGDTYDLLSLPDLVQAKKTQRDRDWPMIRRLVEAHYFGHREHPTPEQAHFWLTELRTPTLLVEVASAHAPHARAALASRPLVQHALDEDVGALGAALDGEERLERERDRQYWLPLRRELEQLRLRRR